MRKTTIALISSIFLMAGIGISVPTETSAHAAEIDSDHGHSHAKDKPCHNHHAGFVKPGAAVALTHDYDGQTAAGEFETVTLSLSHIYEGGFLSVEILPTDNLQVFSNFPLQQIPLEAGSVLNLPVQFSGTKNGTYSVAIETVYKSGEGQESRRVLSLSVTIGAKTLGKSQPAAPRVSKSTPKGFVALPANEVIR